MVTNLNSVISSLNKEINRDKEKPTGIWKGKAKTLKTLAGFLFEDFRLVPFLSQSRSRFQERTIPRNQQRQTHCGVWTSISKGGHGSQGGQGGREPSQSGKQLPTGKSHRVLSPRPEADDWLRREGSAQHAHADRRHGVLSSLRRACCRHGAGPAWRLRRWPRCY